MPLTDMRVWRDVERSVGNRCEEINGFLRVMLDCDPGKRPRVEVLEHHFHANFLRCMIECDLVPPPSSFRIQSLVYFVFLVYFIGGEVDE